MLTTGGTIPSFIRCHLRVVSGTLMSLVACPAENTPAFTASSVFFKAMSDIWKMLTSSLNKGNHMFVGREAKGKK